jgi:hypothetical protein
MNLVIEELEGMLEEYINEGNGGEEFADQLEKAIEILKENN